MLLTRARVRHLTAILSATVLVLFSLAVAADPTEAGVVLSPGHLDFGWKEVSYASVALCGWLIVRYVKGIDKKQDRIFAFCDDHESRLSTLEGAHNAIHGTVHRREGDD